MDTAIALVQAYLHINGYFTVVEYPVLEALRGDQARTVTDLDILAYRYQQNPLRTETPTTAAEIDDRNLDAWKQHPRRHLIEPAGDFLDKAAKALEILRAEMPLRCARHLPSNRRDQGTGGA